MIEPSKQQVQEALDRILASPGFRSSERMNAFLRFVVQYKMSGEPGPLKEYLIADRVFGRGESFDPRTDTIVRVEARRLRSKLQKYYRDEGRNDPVVIELADRGYTPTFRVAVSVASAPPAHGGRPRVWVVAASVAVLGAVGTAAWLLMPRSAPEGAITVLSCENVTSNPDDEPLANGLAIDLRSRLEQILRVIRHTSGPRFKSGAADIPAVARELGVEFVLECHLQKEPERVRVTVRLSAKDGSSLWSRVFDAQGGSALTMQADITRSVVDALSIRLTPSVEARLHSGTTNDRAEWLYLVGRYYWDVGARTMQPADLRRSIEFMNKAIEADPEYAAAYAGLADALGLLSGSGGVDPEQARTDVKAAARKAMDLDDQSAESHFAMGGVFASEGNWLESERSFLRAIDLKRSFGDARQAFAVLCLAPQRRFDEAIEQLRQAVALNPQSATPRTFLGQTLVYAGRPNDAIVELDKAIDLEPEPGSYVSVRAALALAHLANASYHDAENAMRSAQGAGTETPYFRGLQGYTFAKLGQRGKAEDILQELRHIPSAEMEVAAIYNGLGDTRKALDWMVRAHERYGAAVEFSIHDPRFRNLSQEPRFVSLGKESGAPP